MKIKVSEATNVQLDWLVGTIEHSLGFEYRPRTKKCYAYDKTKLMKVYSPTTSWAQGGPIIERERLNLRASGAGDWVASTHDLAHPERRIQYGPTPLTAAMRCFISSRLGEEVEVPDELA